MSEIFENLDGEKPYKGFYWGANSPHIRPVWVTVQRSPKGTAATFPSLNIGPDVNPAAIIYECMTDTVWGMGCPTDLMDTTSFTDAATALGVENFGLSLMWVSQSSVEQFINTVLEHIDATLFVNPKTGLHTIKLIRDDYDVSTLDDINPDNAVLNGFQRRGLGETINEMICTWTNPTNEQEETVTLQSLGNIARQGAVVSSSVNYFGVRNADLAMRLCARELRKSSVASATCEVRVNRQLWNILPGDVVTFTWPEYGAEGVVMRVAEVDYGEPKSSWITLKMSEDVFSLPILNYVEPPATAWEDPSVPPESITNTKFMTLPAYMASVALEEDPDTLVYPEVITGMLATTTNPDTSNFVLGYEQTSSTGAVSWALQFAKNYVATGILPDQLPAEAQSTISSQPILSQGLPLGEGSLILFDMGGEGEQELAHVYGVDQAGIHLNRGVLDTVPKLIPAGTKFWVITHQSDFVDESTNSDGEALNYKLMMTTSQGTFGLDQAAIVTGTATDRPHRPNRPGNVQVQGVGFGTVDLSGLNTASVTWANRNRLTEVGLVQSWTAADTTPESGQTTTIRIFDSADVLINEFPGLTGTSYALDLTEFGDETSGIVEVTAVRDSLEALQPYRLAVTVDGWPTGPQTVGQLYNGGLYAGKFNLGPGDGRYYYSIAARAADIAIDLKWKVDRTATSGVTNAYDGYAGTQAIVAAGIANHPAAEYCVNLNAGGFTDWYLPGHYELQWASDNLSADPEYAGINASQHFWSAYASLSNAAASVRFSDGYNVTTNYKDALMDVMPFRRELVLPFVGNGGWVQANTGTTMTPAYPDNLEENDLLVLIVMERSGVTVPVEWTLARAETAQTVDDVTTQHVSVFTRTVPAGGLSGTISVTQTTSNRMASIILAFRRTDGSAPVIEATTGFGDQHAVSVDPLNFSAITPTVADGCVISIASYFYVNSASNAPVDVLPSIDWSQPSPQTYTGINSAPRLGIGYREVTDTTQITGQVQRGASNANESYSAISLHIR